MPEQGAGKRALVIVADSAAATLYAVEGRPPQARLLGVGHVEYDVGALPRQLRLPELDRFLSEHGLSGCPAHLHFAGAGTVVHPLSMPPMSARHRTKAVRTRLTAYAAGRELCLAEQVVGHDADSGSTQVLAAGVDAVLLRGLFYVLRRSGLRVESVRALTSACDAPAASGPAMQVVLGERTAAIQLFEDGRLVACRDILFGRADFVTAYQRPILSMDGPVTLSPPQAEQLVRDVGVPVDRTDTVLDTVRADQLWPLIAPALQKLQAETGQTMTRHWGEADVRPALSVLCAPPVPGLSAHLVAELGLDRSLIADEDIEQKCLAMWTARPAGDGPLELWPPEERFVQRGLRRALAAAACAMLVILANSAVPRQAEAQRTQLERTASTLENRAAELANELAANRAAHDALLVEVGRIAHLQQALPRRLPAIGLFRAVFATVPGNVTLLSASLDADAEPPAIDLLAAYHGETAAGVVAAGWARDLADAAFCTGAEVTNVDGSGRDGPATIAIHATLP
ncbi:MAG: hypothetical protein PVJ57_06670 [Phycisphaerae bacterium]|jgi:hypothetical protein